MDRTRLFPIILCMHKKYWTLWTIFCFVCCLIWKNKTTTNSQFVCLRSVHGAMWRLACLFHCRQFSHSSLKSTTLRDSFSYYIKVPSTCETYAPYVNFLRSNCRQSWARPFSQIQTDELDWHPHRHTTDNSPITCEAVSRTSRCGRVIPSAAMDTYQQYPSQMLMNWGVYLTDQGAMQGGQGVYSDPWSSPVSTVNTVNTVTSLLKNGQTIFNQDWNTVPINSYGTVSILFIAFLRSKMFKSISS